MEVQPFEGGTRLFDREQRLAGKLPNGLSFLKPSGGPLLQLCSEAHLYSDPKQLSDQKKTVP